MVQDPTCAKVSISGAMAEVPEDGVHEAGELLFSRHPQMRGWPKGHDFRIYELQTEGDQTACLLRRRSRRLAARSTMAAQLMLEQAPRA